MKSISDTFFILQPHHQAAVLLSHCRLVLRQVLIQRLDCRALPKLSMTHLKAQKQ